MTRRLETSWRTRKTPLLRVWWPIQCCDLGHGMKCAGLRISWERVVVKESGFMISWIQLKHGMTCAIIFHHTSPKFSMVHHRLSLLQQMGNRAPTNPVFYTGLTDQPSLPPRIALGQIFLSHTIRTANTWTIDFAGSNFCPESCNQFELQVRFFGGTNKPSFGMRVVPWFSQLSGRCLLTS